MAEAYIFLGTNQVFLPCFHEKVLKSILFHFNTNDFGGGVNEVHLENTA